MSLPRWKGSALNLTIPRRSRSIKVASSSAATSTCRGLCEGRYFGLLTPGRAHRQCLHRSIRWLLSLRAPEHALVLDACGCREVGDPAAKSKGSQVKPSAFTEAVALLEFHLEGRAARCGSRKQAGLGSYAKILQQTLATYRPVCRSIRRRPNDSRFPQCLADWLVDSRATHLFALGADKSHRSMPRLQRSAAQRNFVSRDLSTPFRNDTARHSGSGRQ